MKRYPALLPPATLCYIPLLHGPCGCLLLPGPRGPANRCDDLGDHSQTGGIPLCHATAMQRQQQRRRARGRRVAGPLGRDCMRPDQR